MTEKSLMTDIEATLLRYIPAARELTGKDITLERMRELMAAIGNPERKLKIIHIAGTSGKTSTTYYIAALLKAAGKKVGMTVSPHIDSVAERLQIDLKPLNGQEFKQALDEVIVKVEAAKVNPTYFELLIGVVYWYFAKAKVDYAVIETGLGGLQDGTNIAERADKLCIITDIGIDHTQVLGSTIPEIAKQKAGIIHSGNTALMFNQKPEVTKVFKDWCDQVGAELIVLSPKNVFKTPGIAETLIALPEFQKRNWSLAYSAYKYLQERDILNMLSIEQLTHTTLLQVPGRMEIISVNGKTMIMDGAHNGQKMAAFVSSFKKKYPSKKAAVLLSLKQDKQFEDVLPLLKTISDKLILTTFSLVQDRPVESLAPENLAKAAKRAGFKNVMVLAEQDAAYTALLKQPEDLLIITGSFYLISQLRQKNKELHHA